MRIATLNIRQGGGKSVVALASYFGALNADCLLLAEFRNNQSGREPSAEHDHHGFSHQADVELVVVTDRFSQRCDGECKKNWWQEWPKVKAGDSKYA